MSTQQNDYQYNLFTPVFSLNCGPLKVCMHINSRSSSCSLLVVDKSGPANLAQLLLLIVLMLMHALHLQPSQPVCSTHVACATAARQ